MASTKMNMKKQLIHYHCRSKNEEKIDIAQRFNSLYDFASMLGQQPPMQRFMDYDNKQQPNLQRAIDKCRDEGAYLLCYDLNGLCPHEGRALDIIDALSEELLFVMFVDDESVLKATAPNLYNGE